VKTQGREWAWGWALGFVIGREFESRRTQGKKWKLKMAWGWILQRERSC